MSETDGSPNGGASRLPDAVVADLLEDERRERLLAVLVAAGEPLAVADLARRVGARERGSTPGADEATVDEIRRDLYRRHLPKLTATGVVAYDSQVDRVRLTTDDPRLTERPDDGSAGS
mgnify:CR=1 FL=1